MDNNTERITFVKALRHYSDKLKDLLVNDKDIKKQNMFLKKDIQENADRSNTISDRITANPDTMIPVKDNKEILCSALNCYIHDLEQSKELLKEKLGKNSTFQFLNVETEIMLCIQLRDSVC